MRALPETEGGFNPFFSPDGAWIAFFSADGMLKKLSLAGGRPLVLARDLPNSPWMLGSWSDDGRIAFDTINGGLRVVPVDGGTVTALTAASGEWHLDPQILPHSDVVLYLAQVLNRLRIEAISLGGKKRKTLLDNASHARYLASGHLLFMRDGGLMIAPFDKDRVEVTGPAISVPLEVGIDHPNQSAPVPQMAVALDGTLVYVPVAPGSLRSSTLVWVDRRGTVEEVATLPFASPLFCLSPDGARITVAGREAGSARIDLYDLSRKAATRLIEENIDWVTAPAFSPDGRRLLFGRWNTERSELLAQPVDGSAVAERILSLPGLWLAPSSVSPDGRFVAFEVVDMKSGGDVWIADLQAKQEPRAHPFLATGGSEFSATFSPDGRFIAYSSDETGDFNIYVRRFPEGDAKTRVSTEGGLGAQWSRDGTELFYQAAGGRKLMVVSVREEGGLSFGEPRVVFEGPYLTSIDAGPSYAVSPDARRFLMTRQPNVWPTRASELVVVQNWFEDVRRLTASAR